jgi:hypothetical protein
VLLRIVEYTRYTSSGRRRCELASTCTSQILIHPHHLLKMAAAEATEQERASLINRNNIVNAVRVAAKYESWRQIWQQMTRKKDVDHLISESKANAEASGMRRVLKLSDMIFLAISMIIGAGIFSLLGASIQQAGPAIVVSMGFIFVARYDTHQQSSVCVCVCLLQ